MNAWAKGAGRHLREALASAPGRCDSGALLLVLTLFVLALIGWFSPALARAEPAEKPKKAASDPGKPAPAQKTKSYTFGGLDIDGKLKTPQLLYFLNRMKSEFDTTAPDKRSFLPELKRSPEEM